jgi:vancomycin permeability regulator SanA
LLRKAGRPWRAAAILAALPFAAFALAAALIAYDGLHDRVGKADVGVVLGNKVERNGEPSLDLATRLDEAGELYRRGYFPTVIVSGGVGPGGYDEPAAMRAYLLRQGVPDAAIVLDRGGFNTRATAVDAARWMRARGVSRALVISQFYHLSRTRLAFARCGVRTIYTAHGRRFSHRDVYGLGRDTVGYAVYWLTDRGCGGA